MTTTAYRGFCVPLTFFVYYGCLIGNKMYNVSGRVTNTSTCLHGRSRSVRWNSLGFVAPSTKKHLKSERQQCNIVSMAAAPKRGNIVATYQTVSVNCNKCRNRLFRYKKKNGTKSNLVKCYMERICEDSTGLLLEYEEQSSRNDDDFTWKCPKCDTNFARFTMVRGLPALKLVGGKVRMTKK